MIGQNKLLNKIANLSIDSMPRTTLILGEYGCGKHTLVNVIKDKLNLPLNDITNSVNLDTIVDIYNNPNPTMYLIDISKLDIREENVILKLIEEPLKQSILILIGEDRYNIIDTILNRCEIWEFEPYTQEQLEHFSKNKDICHIFNTPGSILDADKIDLPKTIDFCNNIIYNMPKATYQNALTLTKNIEAYNLKIFVKIFMYCLHKMLINNKSTYLYYLYNRTLKFSKDININNINKKFLIENYILDIKTISREYKDDSIRA